MKKYRSILYFADVHGPLVVSKRSIRRNLSMAGTEKVTSIALALKKQHEVVIYSLGSPAERSGRMYPPIEENIQSKEGTCVKIYYGASIDNRALRGPTGFAYAMWKLPKLLKKHAVDTIIVYNLTFLSIIIASCGRVLGKQVFLEYEDSVRTARETSNRGFKEFFLFYEYLASKLISGVFGASETLSSQPGVENKLCIPGVVNRDILSATERLETRKWSPLSPLKLIYAGGLDASKGIDRFLKALNLIDYDIEMKVCGVGPLAKEIENLCRTNRHKVDFCGYVNREKLVEIMLWADVGINPHLDIHSGGSWPFKVLEYLGSCGTVFCRKTQGLPQELDGMLFLYEGDDIESIRDAFFKFLHDWPTITNGAIYRRNWVLQNFSSDAVAEKLSLMMDEHSSI